MKRYIIVKNGKIIKDYIRKCSAVNYWYSLERSLISGVDEAYLYDTETEKYLLSFECYAVVLQGKEEKKQEKETSEAEKIDFINAHTCKELNERLYLYNGVLFRENLLTGSAYTEATKKEDINYIIDTFYNYYKK